MANALIHDTREMITPREYLDHCLDCQAALESLQQRISSLQNAAENALRMEKSVSPPRPALYPRIEELRWELLARYIALEEARYRAEAMVESLPHPMRAILRARYIDGLLWADVARRTCFSVDHCYTLHRKALRLLDGPDGR